MKGQQSVSQGICSIGLEPIPSLAILRCALRQEKPRVAQEQLGGVQKWCPMRVVQDEVLLLLDF